MLLVPPWIQKESDMASASLFAELLRTGAMIYIWASRITHPWTLQITIISFLSPGLKLVTPKYNSILLNPAPELLNKHKKFNINLARRGKKKNLFAIHIDLRYAIDSRHNHWICLMQAMTTKWNINLCYLRAIFYLYIQ